MSRWIRHWGTQREDLGQQHLYEAVETLPAQDEHVVIT